MGLFPRSEGCLYHRENVSKTLKGDVKAFHCLEADRHFVSRLLDVLLADLAWWLGVPYLDLGAIVPGRLLKD